MNEIDNWVEEKRSAYLYRVVAEVEKGTVREALFRELADAAERQAAIWERVLDKRGSQAPPRFAPDLRSRMVAALVRRLGVRPMRPVLAAMKVRGMALYSKAAPTHYLSPGTQGPEGRHRSMDSGGNLRAAVFGVNDGLVSNASLIFGIAGATGESGAILITGIAGLLAGACSMAAGEYVSVRSQREMYAYQIELERQELDQYPEEEAAELAKIYEAKGLPAAEARKVVDTLFADPQQALDTLAREELGLNPEALGSPSGAAISSFLSFALGALVPVLPFLFASGMPALSATIVLTGIALFGVGAAISLFTGKQAMLGGLRMLGIGATAAGATFLIGKLLGVSLS